MRGGEFQVAKKLWILRARLGPNVSLRRTFRLQLLGVTHREPSRLSQVNLKKIKTHKKSKIWCN